MERDTIEGCRGVCWLLSLLRLLSTIKGLWASSGGWTSWPAKFDYLIQCLHPQLTVTRHRCLRCWWIKIMTVMHVFCIRDVVSPRQTIPSRQSILCHIVLVYSYLCNIAPFCQINRKIIKNILHFSRDLLCCKDSEHSEWGGQWWQSYCISHLLSLTAIDLCCCLCQHSQTGLQTVWQWLMRLVNFETRTGTP